MIFITFEIEGNNNILMFIKWVYYEWLPNSGYEKITILTYIIYDDYTFSKIYIFLFKLYNLKQYLYC